MINENANFDDFDYVIKKKEKTKLAFGTTTSRTTLFSKIKAGSNCGPGSYNVQKPSKPCSKLGSAGITNSGKRTSMSFGTLITPSPCKYNFIPVRTFIQNKAAFNSSVCTRSAYIPKEGPGPTVYNAHKVKLCKRTRFEYNFGKPCMIPYVEIVCVNYPKIKCEKCDEPFDAGDFWHKNYASYLCNFCMEEEHLLHELYPKDILLQYKKIRSCSFMHKHEQTSAKVRIMTNKDIKKKITLENYLSLFNQCHGTKSRTELKVAYNEVI